MKDRKNRIKKSAIKRLAKKADFKNKARAEPETTGVKEKIKEFEGSDRNMFERNQTTSGHNVQKFVGGSNVLKKPDSTTVRHDSDSRVKKKATKRYFDNQRVDGNTESNIQRNAQRDVQRDAQRNTLDYLSAGVNADITEDFNTSDMVKGNRRINRKKSEKKLGFMKRNATKSRISSREKERLKQKRKRVISRRRMKKNLNEISDSSKWFTAETMKQSDTEQEEAGKNEILFAKGSLETASGFVEDRFKKTGNRLPKQNAGMSGIAGRHRKQRYQHDSQYTAVRKYWHGEETGKSDKTRTDVRTERDFETLEDEGRKIKSGIGQRDDRNFEITGLECKKTGNSVKTGMDSSKTGNPSKMGIDGCMTGNSKDFGINNVYSEKTDISSLSDRKASKDYEYRKDYGGIMKYFHSESGFENGRGSKGGIVSKREKIFSTGTISRGETLYKSGTTTESRQITRFGTIAKFGTPPKSGPNTKTGIHTERPLDNQNASYTKYFNRNNTRRIRSSRKLRKNVEKSAAAIKEEDDLIELDRKKRYRKALQKMKIRREYAAAIRKGEEAKQAADYAKKATEKTKSLAQKVIDLVRRHAGLAAIILLFVFMFMFVSTCISSCGSMFGGGSSIVMGGSYESLPNDIDGAESMLSALEAELKDKTYNIMRDYPGYDEYYVYPDYIGHDPFTLVSFLSAEHGIFTASGVQGEVEGLFAEMYDLVLTPTQEIRTRLVTVWSTETDEETGETISVPSTTSEDYTVNVLTARLYRKDLETIVEERLSGNQDAQDLYGAYQVTKGAMQDYYSPLESTWSGSIIKQYGWSKDAAGTSEFHNGIDIAVNPDVDILSAQDGTVTMVTYDDHYGGYVEITGSNGYQSRYGHLRSTNVTVGQSIAHGEVIGKSGHTLPGTACHLHLECIVNGEYYNPVFYFENGQ